MRRKPAFAFLAPMGTTFHCMVPSGVDIAVHGLESSCIGIWWYPCFGSNTVNMRFFCSFVRRSQSAVTSTSYARFFFVQSPVIDIQSPFTLLLF